MTFKRIASVAVFATIALAAVTLTGQTRVNGIWSNWFSNVLTLASITNGQMLTQIKAGSADPEGSVTAPAGSIYMRTNGTIYKKSSGSGNTDWDAFAAGAGAGDALTTDTLAQFAATSCAQFATVISGETGTCGSVVLSASPTFTGTVVAAAITGSGAFASTTLDTGQGANELYDMDQNVLQASLPTFAGLTLTGPFNPQRVTAMPGSPTTGDVVVVTDDSAEGACDSSAGSSISLCIYTGAAWAGLGDGGGVGGATEFDDLGDPSGNGIVALAGTTHAWTSTLDSGIMWSFTNTDADSAADTTFLKLLHNDGGDANVIYIDFVNDADGTPTSIFKVSQTAATLTVDLTVPTEAYDDTGWNGDLTAPTKDAIRDVIATIATFTDPNADKFIFWDDSAGAFVALDMPAAFSISNTTATLTLPYTLQFTAAVCQNATASLGLSTPSSVAATAGCITVAGGSGDAALGYAVFPTGGADTELHGSFELGSDWTGAVDATIKWMSNSTAAGDVVWEIGIGCVANDEVTGAPTFDDTAFTADANHTGAALRLNTATKTGLTVSTCSAGETAMFIIHRDTDTAGDTLDQDVRLVSITFTLRRSVS
jgi:hypothetical protein